MVNTIITSHYITIRMLCFFEKFPVEESMYMYVEFFVGWHF